MEAIAIIIVKDLVKERGTQIEELLGRIVQYTIPCAGSIILELVNMEPSASGGMFAGHVRKQGSQVNFTRL